MGALDHSLEGTILHSDLDSVYTMLSPDNCVEVEAE